MPTEPMDALFEKWRKDTGKYHNEWPQECDRCVEDDRPYCVPVCVSRRDK